MAHNRTIPIDADATAGAESMTALVADVDVEMGSVPEPNQRHATESEFHHANRRFGIFDARKSDE
jgi:hypothetical protein